MRHSDVASKFNARCLQQYEFPEVDEKLHRKVRDVMWWDEDGVGGKTREMSQETTIQIVMLSDNTGSRRRRYDT